jgi:hypothetical protein
MAGKALQAFKKMMKVLLIELYLRRIISGDTVKALFDLFKLKGA